MLKFSWTERVLPNEEVLTFQYNMYCNYITLNMYNIVIVLTESIIYKFNFINFSFKFANYIFQYFFNNITNTIRFLTCINQIYILYLKMVYLVALILAVLLSIIIVMFLTKNPYRTKNKFLLGYR